MNSFFALLSRMKYINRWGLMRNAKSENIAEHSLQTAMIAHALALIENKYLNQNINAERVCLIALYHDAEEILTGDMPTPVKYYNPEIIKSYKQVELVAKDKLLSFLPDKLVDEYTDILKNSDEKIKKLVKAADIISAYIKCTEEIAAGNSEFEKAKQYNLQKLDLLGLESADIFMKEFSDSFLASLDELSL